MKDAWMRDQVFVDEVIRALEHILEVIEPHGADEKTIDEYKDLIFRLRNAKEQTERDSDGSKTESAQQD